jgi:hypothetical protein
VIFVLVEGTYYMMEFLGMASAQPEDGPKLPLLESKMEMIGVLLNGPDDNDDDGGETENTQQNDDEGTEI